MNSLGSYKHRQNSHHPSTLHFCMGAYLLKYLNRRMTRLDQTPHPPSPLCSSPAVARTRRRCKKPCSRQLWGILVPREVSSWPLLARCWLKPWSMTILISSKTLAYYFSICYYNSLQLLLSSTEMSNTLLNPAKLKNLNPCSTLETHKKWAVTVLEM